MMLPDFDDLIKKFSAFIGGKDKSSRKAGMDLEMVEG